MKVYRNRYKQRYKAMDIIFKHQPAAYKEKIKNFRKHLRIK